MATATRTRHTKPSHPRPQTDRGRLTVITDTGTVTAPSGINDLDAFRAWAADPALESVRTWYIDGEVWIDMSNEQVYTHVRLKSEIAAKLYALVEAAELGLFLMDGVLVTNTSADLSGNPDAVFASNDTLTSGRLADVPGKVRGVVELLGTPDMVLEVVSDSSERKDNQTLFEKYWEAGIPEYWLVDARGTELEFTIYRHTAKGYASVRKQAGWSKSAVFGKSFKLTRGIDKIGKDKFTLEVK